MLKDLLEELSQLDTPEKVTTDNKPWWLQKENLLGDVNLDYDEVKQDTKPLIPAQGINEINKENNNKKKIKKIEIGLRDIEKLPVIKPTRIPMKEMSQAISQDYATGGTTNSEGLQQGLGLERV